MKSARDRAIDIVHEAGRGDQAPVELTPREERAALLLADVLLASIRRRPR